MDELVVFERLGANGQIGVARLVREKPLNSLLLETIDLLSVQIVAWLEDPDVHCILLDSSSDRAFCAGADIAALYHHINDGDSYADEFFLREYRLDYALHTADKPIVVWGNGIVMGGGLGLLGGCSHRIGTPATRIAMPEITIGLFPDAGGTAFLSSLPDGLGSFAGLTGCQMSVSDALELDLLDVIVDAQNKSEIFKGLAGLNLTGEAADDHKRVTEHLAAYESRESVEPALLAHRKSIAALMAACEAGEDYLIAFEAGLETLPQDDWLQGAITTYRNGSPLTARIFVEQMRRAAGMSLADMFRMELLIAWRCARGTEFPEGVRALLIDKDKTPAWQYRSHGEVPEETVALHFAPSWDGEHPLSDLG